MFPAVTIPVEARRRLVEPVRAELDRESWGFPRASTIPIPADVWNSYVERLRQAGIAVERAVGEIEPSGPFNSIRRQLAKVVEARNAVVWRSMSLCAFEPFDGVAAARAIERMDSAIVSTLVMIESGRLGVSKDIKRIAFEQPRSAQTAEARDGLCRLFGLGEPPLDETGEFSPSRVFEAFKYDVTSLTGRVLPHVASLGLAPVDDLLALVCICGWIADAPDPVLAYSAMHEMLWALRQRKESADATRTQVHAHLLGRDEALRQTWRRIVVALNELRSATDSESRAHQLADAYKRIIEGPVRQYAWTMRCLVRGKWSAPPTLSPLQAAIAGDGGWLASLLDVVLLTDIRNGQAHESLVWDGHGEMFLVEDGEVSPLQVLNAFRGAVSFVRGCEAAFAHDRAGERERDAGLPIPAYGEQGRLQPWRRAEAFFGTNGLRLRRLVFNSKIAEAHVERLEVEQINPCLQALVLASRLLPKVEEFRVWKDGTDGPVIDVSKPALRLVDPLWEHALNTFTAMPLSTFLPANLSARSRHESESVAARSIAWIAADDALDALDGVGESWTDETRRLVTARIAHALTCLEACAGLTTSLTRINALAEQLRLLSTSLDHGDVPAHRRDVDHLESTRRIRHVWDAWGPVPRLPTIAGGVERPDVRAGQTEPTARLHPANFKDEVGARWRSL